MTSPSMVLSTVGRNQSKPRCEAVDYLSPPHPVLAHVQQLALDEPTREQGDVQSGGAAELGGGFVDGGEVVGS